MVYIVQTTENPGREELKWALRFTALERAGFKCQNCGTGEQPLDVAHIESRATRPDLEFDPKNVMILCRPCHGRADHARGHRPSGRPIGYKHSAATRERMRRSAKRSHNTPEYLAKAARISKESWNVRGRKPLRVCAYCDKPLTRLQTTQDRKFCGRDCTYSSRRGLSRDEWRASFPPKYA